MSAKSELLDSLDGKKIQVFLNHHHYDGVMGTDFQWTDVNDKGMLSYIGTYGTYICLSHIREILELVDLPQELDLIVNPSFEDPVIGGPGYQAYASGNTDITGWAISGTGVDIIDPGILGAPWASAPSGDQFVELASTGQGTITQEISGLTNGHVYRVTFSYGKHPDKPGSNNMDVTAGPTGPVTFSSSQVDFVTGQIEFTASSDKEDLTFASTDGSSWGMTLDDIKLYRIA